MDVVQANAAMTVLHTIRHQSVACHKVLSFKYWQLCAVTLITYCQLIQDIELLSTYKGALFIVKCGTLEGTPTTLLANFSAHGHSFHKP